VVASQKSNPEPRSNVDNLLPEARSRVMARVRSTGNRSTEWRVRSILMRAGLRGWKLHSIQIEGRPDFAFPRQRLAIFVDGCFWHGCPKCKRTPHSNTEYWERKIERNIRRDRMTTTQLRRAGWRVIRLWEHQLNRTEQFLKRIEVQLFNAR
jgi:DNA mismatch endonuclease, patch repair protein